MPNLKDPIILMYVKPSMVMSPIPNISGIVQNYHFLVEFISFQKFYEFEISILHSGAKQRLSIKHLLEKKPQREHSLVHFEKYVC